jgi:signal transduction histidine kinase
MPENINLLIIDNGENVKTLMSSLIDENFNIFTTKSAQKAFQICLDNDISIAIIAMEMPDMDGYALLDKIKNNPLTDYILVIFTIEYASNSDSVVKGLHKGAIDYLHKPFDLNITIAKIRSLVTLVNFRKEITEKNVELQHSKNELFKAIDQTKKSTMIKENFLANMSHEIRTPLNAIIGLINLLKESPVDNHQKKLIKLMGFSSNALLGIVNDILESAKIDAGKVEIVKAKTSIIKLVKTVADLIRPMANEKGLNLICEISAETPAFIMADALRLNQILLNIINNSIKFTNQGEIVISLKPLESTQNRVLLEFKIRDTGIGIPKESIKTIFTRFEQIEDKTWQEFGGTGLGLSIVKRLIELKGGNLDIESEVNKGTTLSFTNWYTLADDVEDISDTEDHKHSSSEDILILLVDDNPVNQFIVVEMLKEWNINVDIANNGLEAFEKLKSNNYKLILMDTHMPVMNGNDATRKIRKEMSPAKKDIPIISFSASVIENEKSEAKSAGVDDFIDKPFEPNSLVKKIRKLTDKKNNPDNGHAK